MFRKIFHHLLILLFVFGTTQTFGMSCHMYEKDDSVQVSDTQSPCHSMQMNAELPKKSSSDKSQSDCSFCKACSSNAMFIVDLRKHPAYKNYQNKDYAVSNYHPIFIDTPTPPPNA